MLACTFHSLLIEIYSRSFAHTEASKWMNVSLGQINWAKTSIQILKGNKRMQKKHNTYYYSPFMPELCSHNTPALHEIWKRSAVNSSTQELSPGVLPQRTSLWYGLGFKKASFCFTVQEPGLTCKHCGCSRCCCTAWVTTPFGDIILLEITLPYLPVEQRSSRLVSDEVEGIGGEQTCLISYNRDQQNGLWWVGLFIESRPF